MKGFNMAEWVSINREEPEAGEVYDIMLAGGQVVNGVMAEEYEIDGFEPVVGFPDYLSVAKFRKAE